MRNHVAGASVACLLEDPSPVTAYRGARAAKLLGGVFVAGLASSGRQQARLLRAQTVLGREACDERATSARLCKDCKDGEEDLLVGRLRHGDGAAPVNRESLVSIEKCADDGDAWSRFERIQPVQDVAAVSVRKSQIEEDVVEVIGAPDLGLCSAPTGFEAGRVHEIDMPIEKVSPISYHRLVILDSEQTRSSDLWCTLCHLPTYSPRNARNATSWHQEEQGTGRGFSQSADS